MAKERDVNKGVRGLIEWTIYITGYSIVLIAISSLFPKTLYVDSSGFGVWAFLAAAILYILNKTVKPIFVWLTLPLTAITLGLFYPFINVFILHITHYILFSHFEVQGLFMSVIVALLISLMNTIMEKCVLKPLLGKDGKYE
jgi:Predicted membrane protein